MSGNKTLPVKKHLQPQLKDWSKRTCSLALKFLSVALIIVVQVSISRAESCDPTVGKTNYPTCLSSCNPGGEAHVWLEDYDGSDATMVITNWVVSDTNNFSGGGSGWDGTIGAKPNCPDCSVTLTALGYKTYYADCWVTVVSDPVSETFTFEYHKNGCGGGGCGSCSSD